MTEFSRFFGSAGGDIRQYNQVEFSQVLSRFSTNGIFPDIGAQLAISEAAPPQLAVQVATGEAFINGYWYKNDTNFNLTLAAAPATNSRIDLIVLRLDVVSTRLITVVNKTGTVAASPIPPTLQQDSSIWEIPLAEVLVRANVIQIFNADITKRDPGQAMPRNLDQLNDLIFRQKGYKSWLLQRTTDNTLYFVPSLSINGVDWDFSNQILLLDSGGIVANGQVNSDEFWEAGVKLANKYLPLTSPNDIVVTAGAYAYKFQTDSGFSAPVFVENNQRIDQKYVRVNQANANTAAETARCGISGMQVIANATGIHAGVYVPFKARRATVPTAGQITLQEGSKSPATLAAPLITDITADGFWMYINGINPNPAGTFMYWRGTYTVV